MKRLRLLPLVLVVLVLACRPGNAPRQTPADALDDAPADLEARFGAELDRIRIELSLPGATAAYALPDGSVGVAASGQADLESQTPMTPRSRMLAASIGKSFVAATAIALSHEGQLDLDGRIETWLSDRPWFSRLPNHEAITVRQLLTHSSGLPDHVHTPEFASHVAIRWREPGKPFPPESLVQYVLDKPALFPAGQGWSYTDTGYVLVGMIIEQASGRPYYDELRKRLIGPLRLDATSPSDRRELSGLTAGYTAKENPLGLPAKTTTSPGVMAWDPAIEWTGGGLVTTSRDLAVWARSLCEGQALPRPYLGDLLDSVPVGGEDSGVRYGAGVAIHQKTPHGPSYGHGGTIPGYNSSMRYYPDHRVAVAFQMNTDVERATSAMDSIEQRLADVVIGGARVD